MPALIKIMSNKAKISAGVMIIQKFGSAIEPVKIAMMKINKNVAKKSNTREGTTALLMIMSLTQVLFKNCSVVLISVKFSHIILVYL
jgi:hypothetical protein